MDLADHFRIIANNWWRILLVAILVGAGAYVFSSQRSDVFEATAELSITPGQRSSFPITRDETVFLTDTYAARATTRPVIERAITDGHLNVQLGDATDRVAAKSSGDVGFMAITAEGPTGTAAAKLANALVAALITDVRAQQDQILADDLETVNKEIDQVAAQLATLPDGSPQKSALEVRYAALNQAASERRTEPRDRIDLISSAVAPSVPASPKPVRDAALGFLVALVLAAELSVAIRSLGDRLPRTGDPEAIVRLLGVPVLVEVPRGAEDDQSVVEAFRSLRTSLVALPPEYRPRTIMIASANAGAGKSFTAINLARTMAAQQSGVLIVDADLRRPVLHIRLDIAREPGLSDVLAGRNVRGAVHSVGLPTAYGVDEPRRFLALPAGPPVRDPVVALGQNAVRRVMDAMDEQPNLVIIDTPPSVPFGDAAAVAPQCDATIVVIDIRKTGMRATRSMITALTRSGANILGVVLNRAGGGRSRAHRYYGA
jgi:capsular exopolysaccharide synthesis family protein